MILGDIMHLAVYRHILRIARRLREGETLYIRDFDNTDGFNAPEIDYSMSGVLWSKVIKITNGSTADRAGHTCSPHQTQDLFPSKFMS